jgi:hypothetical protein
MAILLRVARDIYEGKVTEIKITDLPRDSLEAWNKIGALTMVPIYRITKPNGDRKSGADRLSPRVVKHVLADGTEKEYRYPRYYSRKQKVASRP